MKDIDFRRVLSVFGTAVAIALVAVGISATFLRFSRPARPSAHVPRSAPQVAQIHQTPILTDRHGWRDREAALAALGRYGWADRDAGIAQIPIETAMDEIARELQDGKP